MHVVESADEVVGYKIMAPLFSIVNKYMIFSKFSRRLGQIQCLFVDGITFFSKNCHRLSLGSFRTSQFEVEGPYRIVGHLNNFYMKSDVKIHSALFQTSFDPRWTEYSCCMCHLLGVSSQNLGTFPDLSNILVCDI